MPDHGDRVDRHVDRRNQHSDSEKSPVHSEPFDEKMNPYYFLVVFWGAEHRGHFVDLALASLLSANNIPALDNPGGRNRFLIATTRDDWHALEQEPIFERLKDHMVPELVEIPTPAPAPGASPMLTMSSGHKRLTDRAFDASAYGVHICPDVVYSDGSVAAVQKHARAGRKVVLTAAVRFALEGVMRELTEKGYLRKGDPLTMRARDAVGIGLRNPHGEFLAADWTSPFFWDFPVYTWWEVPGEGGVVQHTYSWSPVLIDYGALDEHFTEIFDDWTLDGDYVYMNFKHLEDEVHVVTDSDEVFLLPMTRSDTASPPRKPHWSKTWPVLGNWTRAYLLDMVHNHRVMDPLKRRIFFMPVLWHTKPLTPAWEEVGEEVTEILCRSIASPIAKEILLGTVGAAKDRAGAPSAAGRGRLGSKRWKILFDTPLRICRRCAYLAIHVFLKEIPRYVALVFAYARVTVLACLGDKAERERIRRRFRIIRAAIQNRGAEN